jgi:hypothetical protein
MKEPIMSMRRIAYLTAEVVCLALCTLIAAPYFLILLSPFVGQ